MRWLHGKGFQSLLNGTCQTHTQAIQEYTASRSKLLGSGLKPEVADALLETFPLASALCQEVQQVSAAIQGLKESMQEQMQAHNKVSQAQLDAHSKVFQAQLEAHSKVHNEKLEAQRDSLRKDLRILGLVLGGMVLATAPDPTTSAIAALTRFLKSLPIG